jgi:ubiquinone/menaquinone biosynthesis C-methylase UbiE
MFIALSSFPGLKKKLWRGLYDYLARIRRADDWTFMNYGYAMANSLVLDPEDERDRYCIQLYDHVAGAVDLKGRCLVEVGSGRGGGASFIKRYMEPARMIGVDLSSKAVSLCRERHRIEGLEFRVGDAENLPFDDVSVDAVINVESSHCYPSFEKFVSEVYRVLRPGGHFLYADFRDRANVGAWRENLQRFGFTLVHETDITQNVLTALDCDNERKAALINRLVPSLLRPSFNDFAGMRGTGVYEGFRSGSLIYMSFVLRKDVPHF